MRGGDIDPVSAESKGSSRFGEIGRRLCGCCISKGNKLRPVELTKSDAITNQPALSKISVLKKDVFNEHDNEAKVEEPEINVVSNDGIVPKTNGDVSPLTAKRLKEDCSNVTTVALDDLIGTSAADIRPKDTQVSIDEQLAYVVEDANAYEAQRIVQESRETNEKRGENYEQSFPTIFAENELPNVFYPTADYRSRPAGESHGKVPLWEEKDGISEMEDITDMLFETPPQSDERNAIQSSQNTQNTVRRDSQALAEVLPPQPPSCNQGQTTAITGCTITGIDSSDYDSDSDEEVASHQRRDSKIAYTVLNRAKRGENPGQHIPTAAIPQPVLFSYSLDSEGECNSSLETRGSSSINPLQKSAASMRLNHTEDLDSELNAKVNGPIHSEIKNAFEGVGYADDPSQKIGILKTQNDDCHRSSELKESKPMSPLQRPTRMYASSSSSSGDEEETEKEQNVTRLSVKSNGDAAINSTTASGEVVSVQLASPNVHSKFGDAEVFTDDEFPERLI